MDLTIFWTTIIFFKYIPLSAKFPAGVQPNYSHRVQCFYSLYSLTLSSRLQTKRTFRTLIKKAHTLFGHIVKIHTNMRKKRVYSNWVVNRKSLIIINFLVLIWLFILPIWWARFKIYILWFSLLAPTGALILMMVRDISVAPAFSDFEHLCLSILLQVSLKVA